MSKQYSNVTKVHPDPSLSPTNWSPINPKIWINDSKNQYVADISVHPNLKYYNHILWLTGVPWRSIVVYFLFSRFNNILAKKKSDLQALKAAQR